MGASSRLARLLSRAWPEDFPARLTWQSRGPVAGLDVVAMPLLEDPEKLAALCAGADVVLNLAGVVPTHAARAGAAVDFADNSRLALAALEAAREAGVGHVFLISSAAVYGAADHPQDETSPPAPSGAYGRAKAEMEAAALNWQQAAGASAPGVSLLRLGNIVGADALIGAAGGGPVWLDRFADGRSPLRSYIGPATLARVLAALMARATAGQALPALLNVAAPEPVEMQDLCRAAGLDWQPRAAPATAIARLVLDTRRLQQLYRFSAADSRAAEMVAQFRKTEVKAE
ncbi:NAD-dependent epimerase/dehydratase family protein [Shimia sp.]|uniref:NAD-dependent epimerase/dehydratase family protein n=1 Tax=Shimia sp. TaxID=1954381 RepID=UPI003566E418